jgi:hypothetical protein
MHNRNHSGDESVNVDLTLDRACGNVWRMHNRNHGGDESMVAKLMSRPHMRNLGEISYIFSMPHSNSRRARFRELKTLLRPTGLEIDHFAGRGDQIAASQAKYLVNREF